ncbi:MAG: M28 family peptidase [Gemmatimonadota bacterium]|nr:MAG: M28 family peptidase [Gemmatimonadota bacterium]
MSERRASRVWAGRVVATAAAIVATACGGADGEGGRGPAASAATSEPRFDGAAAFELVVQQVAFGPRVPGSAGHRAMAEWLEEYLSARADTLIVQRFSHVALDGRTLPLVNFLARFRPSASPPVLLLAHWDTRPVSDQALEPEDRGKPVPGANDGASGTAVLLQLADMLHRVPPPRGVDVLLVDGEDYGDFTPGDDVFLGSRYFASHLPQDYAAEYGVLLDMVGDRDLDIYVEGNSNQLAPEVVDRVWGVAQRLGFSDVFHRRVRHTINDDHIPLNEAGIPTINVIDFDFPYWHTPEDTPDKVSASSLGVVGAVVTRLVYRGR